MVHWDYISYSIRFDIESIFE